MQFIQFFWSLVFPRWLLLGVNNPTIKGNSAVLWGTGSTLTAANGGGSSLTVAAMGIIISAEKGSSADKIEVQDENGYTIAVIYFNHKNECSFSMIVKTALPAMIIGDTFTLAGVAFCICEDIRAAWSNKDNTKFDVKGTRYQAITADS